MSGECASIADKYYHVSDDIKIEIVDFNNNDTIEDTHIIISLNNCFIDDYNYNNDFYQIY